MPYLAQNSSLLFYTKDLLLIGSYFNKEIKSTNGHIFWLDAYLSMNHLHHM